jgi:hypothetical protein
LDPADIGDCVDNQFFAANGDAQEHTTKGLMAWRKLDNATVFTDGATTWMTRPSWISDAQNRAVVSRPNNRVFAWETPGVGQAARVAPQNTGLTLTVNSATQIQNTAGISSSAAPAGKAYLVLDVTIANDAPPLATPEQYNAASFTLKDSSGVVYDRALYQPDHAIGLDTLAPSDSVRGSVAFLVPANTYGYLLLFDRGTYFANTPPLKFAVW